LSSRSIDRRAERKEAATATANPESSGGSPSMSKSPRAAAKTAGTLMRKEIRNASTPEYLLTSRTEDVRPDLESPGMAEKPWATPRMIPSWVPSDLAVLVPPLPAPF